jgi:protein-disulfide isomerase
VIRTWWKLASFALVAALVAPSLVAQTKLTPAELTRKKSLGSPTAPITLEIFSDYQCPACREMYLATTRQIINNYVSTGKVYLVHRDFPLAMHPYSRVAARWLNAAAAAGFFQPAEEALYTKQDQWGVTGQVEQALASSLSTEDMKKVRAVELSQRVQLDAIVQSDVNMGTSRNITGTPTTFVIHNGQTIPLPSGPVPYPLLKQYLDSLLAKR